MTTCGCLYVNCIKRFSFLAEASTKLQKNAFFIDNLRATTQEGNMATRQITPFFHLLFPL